MKKGLTGLFEAHRKLTEKVDSILIPYSAKLGDAN